MRKKNARCLVAVGLLVLLSICLVRGEDDSVRLKPSVVHDIGAADPDQRAEALKTLLADGPIRLEEIQRAERTLKTILDMYAVLQTPHRDQRVGKAVRADELKEAVDFFINGDAIQWLLQDLNDDRETRFEVSEGLLKAPDDLKKRNKALLVEKLILIVNAPRDEVGSRNTMRTQTSANFSRLLADLIGQPIKRQKEDDLSIDWNEEGPRIARLAAQWLKGKRRHASSAMGYDPRATLERCPECGTVRVGADG